MRTTGASSIRSMLTKSSAVTICRTAIVLAAIVSSTLSAAESEVEITRRAISDKIKHNIVRNPSFPKNATVTVDVVVKDNGYADMIIIRKSGGSLEYDRAVINAVNWSQPLPMPATAALRKYFREMELLFRAQP